MKVHYIAFIGALLSTFTAFGQALFGVQGSLQSSNWSVSTSGVSVSFDRKTAFRVGVMADVPVSSAASFRPQLLYSVKGFSVPAALGAGSDNSASLNYLEVPLQFTYGFPAGSGNFVIGAGPYLSYLLSQSDGSTTSTTINEGVNRFDLGATLSAGYDTAGGLALSLYFSPGFSNIIKESALGGTGTDASIRNTSFGLNVGYFFGSTK